MSKPTSLVIITVFRRIAPSTRATEHPNTVFSNQGIVARPLDADFSILVMSTPSIIIWNSLRSAYSRGQGETVTPTRKKPKAKMRADEQQADQAQIRWDELATHSEVLFPLSCVSGYIQTKTITSFLLLLQFLRSSLTLHERFYFPDSIPVIFCSLIQPIRIPYLPYKLRLGCHTD